MVPLPPRNPDVSLPAIRTPALWPWVTLLIGALGSVAMILWQGSPLKLPSLEPHRLRAPSDVRAAVDEPRQVRLFFPEALGETLEEVDRVVMTRASLAEEVRAVLRDLASGASGLPGVLPAAAEVRQVFLDAFGILYLDFSKKFQETIGTSISHPDLAISAIVATLTTSFSEVKRVQFLVEGQEIALTIGAWDLRRPVWPVFPGDAAPSAPLQPQQ